MFKKNSKLNGAARRKVFVDTSTLIDGRILAVAKTGFIGDELLIPRSVLGELQLLADGGDSDKRARARFGLDVVKGLQEIDGLMVTIYQDDREAREGVDDRLMDLAKSQRALIMTNDFNLNKVATVDGIQVLNINDLTQSIRSEYLPGDKLQLELVQKGSERGQTVGYLPDGTMVVVEDSANYLNKKIEVEFIRYLQTSAGKMMFAKKAESVSAAPVVRSVQPQKPQPRPVFHSGDRVQKAAGGASNGRDTRRNRNARDDGRGRDSRGERRDVAAPARQQKPKFFARRNDRRKETNEERFIRLANGGDERTER